VTLDALAKRYLTYKKNTSKKSVKDDRRILTNRLLPDFGQALQVLQLTEARIVRFEERRIGEVSAYTVSNELGTLRHLLRLARKWGFLDRVPDIALPKKPKGQTRFLNEEEIDRPLQACVVSQSPYLLAMVVLAMNAGMRKGEALGLIWERTDPKSGLGFRSKATLYETKSGTPRSVPLNAAAVTALTALDLI